MFLRFETEYKIWKRYKSQDELRRAGESGRKNK